MELIAEQGDAEGFIARARAILCGIGRVHRPREIIVVRIDSWFGPKWHEFSGEVHGALGDWREDLTLPPFVPSRVVSQHHYREEAPGFFALSDRKSPLHLSQASSDNRKRLVARIAPGTALVWVSGKTAENGRGSFMAYLPTSEGHSPWYADFIEKDGWQARILRGISRQELTNLERQGAVATPDPAESL